MRRFLTGIGQSFGRHACAVLLGGVLATDVASAHTLQVLDQHGKALEDAVVELVPAQQSTAAPAKGTMTQRGLMFVPFVLAVQQGSAVEFPNQDKTRHHVYSFSPAKVFELKLYAGKPEQPVLFDKPGIVVLGCNIHDHMQAYVYVGTSPYLGVSNAQGQVTFAELPSGTATLKVWHPWQTRVIEPTSVELVALPSSVTIDITPSEKPKPPKRGFGQSY